MRRAVFDDNHEVFRSTMRDFIAAEVTPHYGAWEAAGRVPRDFYLKLGKLGILGFGVPEEYGGSGPTPFTYNAVIAEECARAGVTFGGASAHLALPATFVKYTTPEQKERWLPGFVTGELMTAIAITEPDAGSDVAGLQTAAELAEDATHYLVNGVKAFVSGGAQADLVLVACRTPGADPADRRGGMSLLAVDTRAQGVEVSAEPATLGLRSSDIVEMTFTDVRVPVGDVVGGLGNAFSCLADIFAQERLGIAMGAYAHAAGAVHFATAYVKERTAFGKPVAAFQNTKFVLADCKAEVDALQAVVDRALAAFDAGELTADEAASAKLYCTDAAARVIDKCVQLHGGYGFIMDNPIARLYADNRASRIFGGTSEIMRTIVAKSMGL
ncbi:MULTISPECIES: acyl-CoA dehydrogenase family protein [unclassified Streptomyces]|uniref:acyl-CoA dehydrogenase family protein n=1 Tax=unclassified Streptomyces TaxID=2593676 RepID=UPI001BEBDB43|nr:MULTISPECIES: acyl-CoA dehydrogenase family protein [unclassified Streptomyces]MBT2408751.1 acyl-CoA dehydrogenase family protein [Streptomyces sp. ISL-21]MBT2458007.1 acyl-CoA dehydrogenase family protein [Streptomyces sp. ISL-86]MBT2613837.1 acyl-CoA dehydrogenase family protein [Streptomyces sp. ISL-87]